jgi:hypothetical protein
MGSDPEDTDARIRNRESWLRIGVVATLTGVVGWKVVTGSLALSSIDFPTLLSVLLSLFAIALSVAFYLKATETSNSFYDNTYRFTKDVSEILGRIEAGFGERLRHLDEGYAGLRDSVTKLPRDPVAAQRELGAEEATIKRLEEEKKQVLDQLAERAKLQDAEKSQLFEQMAAKDRELRQARAETASMRRRMLASPASATPESRESRESTDSLLHRITRYTRDHVTRTLMPTETLRTEGAIRERFAEVRDALPGGYLKDLESLGYLEPGGQLTSRGINWFLRQARHGPTS